MFNWLNRGGNRREAKLSRVPVPARSREILPLVASDCRSGFLPFEGWLYDPIGITNFIDLDEWRPGFKVGKGIKIDALSNMLDMDLPTKLSLGGEQSLAVPSVFQYQRGR